MRLRATGPFHSMIANEKKLALIMIVITIVITMIVITISWRRFL